jgi:hypothetical protein
VLLIFLVFCVFTLWVPCCDFRIQALVGSSLLPVVSEVVAKNGKSIEIGNACHTRQRIKTNQKQAKNEHNVRWTPLSASKHK